MVLVPEGAFMMGCNEEVDEVCANWEDTHEGAPSDEKPYHEVWLCAFEIDETEVTQAAYQECVRDDGCTEPAESFDPEGQGDHPVTDVTWEQARNYCRWAGKRLPTEAEWEKAARGADGRIYPWGNEWYAAICEWANVRSDCADWTEPVGSHPAGKSPYGALDMAGNAAGWAEDWMFERYYRESPERNPPGPDLGMLRVIRGTSERTSNRTAHLPSSVPYYAVGLRCAK